MFVRLVWPNGRWSHVPEEDAKNQQSRIASATKVSVRILTDAEHVAELKAKAEGKPGDPAAPVTPAPPSSPVAPDKGAEWADKLAKARELGKIAAQLSVAADKARAEAKAHPNPQTHTAAKKAVEAADAAREEAEAAAKGLVG
jgi:hypothetical protein